MAKSKLDAALRGLIGASKVKNQKDFGDKLGYNKSYVSELMNEAQPITDPIKERIRTVFGISKQWWDLPIDAPLVFEPSTGQKIHALAQETGKPHGDDKSPERLTDYLLAEKLKSMQDKIDEMHRWKREIEEALKNRDKK